MPNAGSLVVPPEKLKRAISLIGIKKKWGMAFYGVIACKGSVSNSTIFFLINTLNYAEGEIISTIFYLIHTSMTLMNKSLVRHSD